MHPPIQQMHLYKISVGIPIYSWRARHMTSPLPPAWHEALQVNPSLGAWFSHWASSLHGHRSPLQDELPWMTYGAIEWLSKHLQPHMRLFEWGSGGSTAFFAKRVEQVVTVEHDAAWYQTVVEKLNQQGYSNTSLALIEPTSPTRSDPWYRSTDPRYTDLTFSRYVGSIDQYPNEYFDIVVVDGRARPDCIRHAVPKIKRGGYLLLDNSERVEYEKGWDVVRHWDSLRMWGPGPYNEEPWETRVWRRGF
jgi:hypothetical protein